MVAVTDGAESVDAPNGPYWLTIDATSIAIDPAILKPEVFALHQNYPNPFNNTTTIRYAVPEETDIQLEIFHIGGRLVETLISQLHQPGFYDLKWSGRQDASGIYFIKLEAAKTVLTQKMILLE